MLVMDTITGTPMSKQPQPQRKEARPAPATLCRLFSPVWLCCFRSSVSFEKKPSSPLNRVQWEW